MRSLPPRRPMDLLTVLGPSMVVVTDHEGSRNFPLGAVAPDRAPDLLDAWDRYLDSKDAAHENADGKLAEA